MSMLSIALSGAVGSNGGLPGRLLVGEALVSIVARSYTSGADGGSGYYEQGEQYERRPPRYMPQSKGSQGAGATLTSLLQNQKQLGALLLALGLFLSIMGMALFFEGNLLRLGNICIILGIPLLLGPDRVRGFFMKESRIQASLITSLGIILVFWGKPRLGILLEVFGLLNLFGNMFPLLFALAKRMPIIGDVLSSFEAAGSRAGGGGGGERRRRQPEF